MAIGPLTNELITISPYVQIIFISIVEKEPSGFSWLFALERGIVNAII